MQRLRIGQLVDVSLDGEPKSSEFCVVSVRGPVATLERSDELGQHVRARLATGALGSIVFDHRDVPVALRGVARALPDHPALEFIVVHGVQLSERPVTAPALVIRARLAELSPDHTDAVDWVETVTADVSLGGALLVRDSALRRGRQWLIKLVLSDTEASISCRAALTWETLAHIGVTFVDMHEGDRIRLAGVLADNQRGVAPAA